MYAKALIVLEGDKKGRNKDDSSDNDKCPFAFSSKGDELHKQRGEKISTQKLRWYPQLQFAT